MSDKIVRDDIELQIGRSVWLYSKPFYRAAMSKHVRKYGTISSVFPFSATVPNYQNPSM